MAKGETTKRSDLDADHLIARLRTRAAERLADQEEIWAIVDPSELRKPYAKERPDLMRVRKLGGEGTVRGQRTINVLGVGTGGVRGLLYHHLFSSVAADFLSESREIQDALLSVEQVLAAKRGHVTSIMDSQFDDIAVWGTIGGQDNHLVCRLKHLERLIEPGGNVVDGAHDPSGSVISVAAARDHLRVQTRVRTEMLVKKVGQRFPKRPPTTVVIRACPIGIRYQTAQRTPTAGPVQTKPVWLVEVRLENVATDPWLLLTDWPVNDEASALRIFRMYRTRWAIEIDQPQCPHSVEVSYRSGTLLAFLSSVGSDVRWVA